MNQAEFRIRRQTDGILRLSQAVLIYRERRRVPWRPCMRSRKSMAHP